MLFALICRDKPDHLAVRQDTRPAHLEFLNSLGGDLKFAGPFLDDAGAPNGSLVMIQAEDIEAAKAIAARDPYATAGLFADVEILPWVWALKKPEGV